jgi:hypothetical protein
MNTFQGSRVAMPWYKMKAATRHRSLGHPYQQFGVIILTRIKKIMYTVPPLSSGTSDIIYQQDHVSAKRLRGRDLQSAPESATVANFPFGSLMGRNYSRVK